MDIEEANKALEELSKDVRPEMLNDKAKRLFNAIMKIADERDEVKSDLYEANNRIVDLIDIIDKKDKIINEMAEIIEECRQNNCLESDEIDLSEIAGKDRIIDYFTKKVEGK